MAGATTVATSLATTPAKWPAVLTGVTAAAGAGATPDLLSLPGFGAVPPKLIKRIVAKEFIDMWELLPETWQLETEATCCHSKRPRRALVTDIGVWTECYATMAAILSSAYPSKAPQFFAYLRTITKASRTFESAAWATYDMAFRRQAANRGNLDWGTIDTALYNEAFTGRAKTMARCRYCLADTHSSTDCPNAPAGAVPSTETANPDARSGRRGLGQQSRERTGSVDICRLFNAPGGSRCRFSHCRYAHLCSRCRRPHSLAECGERRGTPTLSEGPGVQQPSLAQPPQSS